MINLSFQMGLIIGGGTFLGIWLDDKIENSFSGFTIGCSLVAIFISLYLVLKQLNNLNDQ